MRGDDPTVYFYDPFRIDKGVNSQHWEHKHWKQIFNKAEQRIYEDNCGQHCLAMIAAFMKYGDIALSVI